MTETTTTPDPIFVSVNEAARILGLTPWSVYKLCDAGEVENRYHGRRRLVVFASLKAYAKNLPTTAPVA